jgi:hypothetical protein
MKQDKILGLIIGAYFFKACLQLPDSHAWPLLLRTIFLIRNTTAAAMIMPAMISCIFISVSS